MPIYTYRCTSCGIQFDKQQKFSDQSLTRCPECSKKTLQKVFQPVGIVFKGSGFYSTDHRSHSGGGRPSKSSSSESEKSTPDSSSASETNNKPSSSDSGSSAKE
jgi:putative FmdB family regulatory protein